MPSYWLVDPDQPSVTVLELRDGTYVQAAAAGPGQRCRVQLPFALELVPDLLLQ